MTHPSCDYRMLYMVEKSLIYNIGETKKYRKLRRDTKS